MREHRIVLHKHCRYTYTSIEYHCTSCGYTYIHSYIRTYIHTWGDNASQLFASPFSSEITYTYRLVTVENWEIQLRNSWSSCLWYGRKIMDVVTMCFSNRLIKGIGNLSYTLSMSAIKINLGWDTVENKMTLKTHSYRKIYRFVQTSILQLYD